MKIALGIAGFFAAEALDHILWKLAQVRINDTSWYVWIAWGDNPCHKCLVLDGRILLGKDIPVFPLHPACQCGLYEIDAEWLVKCVLVGDATNTSDKLEFTPSNLTELKEIGIMLGAN